MKKSELKKLIKETINEENYDSENTLKVDQNITIWWNEWYVQIYTSKSKFITFKKEQLLNLIDGLNTLKDSILI